VTPCSVVVRHQLFGGPCCLYFLQQGPPKILYPTATLHSDFNERILDFNGYLVNVPESSVMSTSS
jgi:hypothetical protein